MDSWISPEDTLSVGFLVKVGFAAFAGGLSYVSLTEAERIIHARNRDVWDCVGAIALLLFACLTLKGFFVVLAMPMETKGSDTDDSA